jgi:chloride channel protein, CIC family
VHCVGCRQEESTYTDELLNVAISKMLKQDVGRLPVVERSNPKRIVGYLGRANIMAARTKHMEEEDLREKHPWLARTLRLPKLAK